MEFPPVALVAIGGFGRAELNPHSDIDFMFLHEGQVAAGKPLPFLAKLIDGVLYPLWDIGLKDWLFRARPERLRESGEHRHAIQNLAHRIAAHRGR